MRIAWTEGVDISDLNLTTGTPDFYKLYSGGDPIAAPGTAPTTALGLVDYLNGAQEAIVYLPYLIPGSGAQLINDKDAHIMATMNNDAQIESILGNEKDNFTGKGGEVFRVSTIILRETR